MAETALAAFLNDAASRRVVQEMDRDAKVQRGTVRNAAWTFRTDRPPEILLVDLDGEHNLIVYVPALMQVCRPESMILVTGSENNVALANELYRSGVFLYLPKPLDATNLRPRLGYGMGRALLTFRFCCRISSSTCTPCIAPRCGSPGRR